MTRLGPPFLFQDLEDEDAIPSLFVISIPFPPALSIRLHPPQKLEQEQARESLLTRDRIFRTKSVLSLLRWH